MIEKITLNIDKEKLHQSRLHKNPANPFLFTISHSKIQTKTSWLQGPQPAWGEINEPFYIKIISE
jgi:hypothetical protein